MIYTKIPRKLKKRLKKIVLKANSENYKKYRKMNPKNITIISYYKLGGTFEADLKN